MDKTDYAIIGYVDEGGSAEPVVLQAILGGDAQVIAEKVSTLRLNGILPYTWARRYAQARIAEHCAALNAIAAVSQ